MVATEAYFLEVSEVPASLSVLELEVSVAHPAVRVGQALQAHSQVCLQELCQLVQEPAKWAHDPAKWAQDSAK